MDVDSILKNRIILKLRTKIADLTLQLAESESKAELFKEQLEIRDRELAELQKDDEKMKDSDLENVVK